MKQTRLRAVPRQLPDELAVDLNDLPPQPVHSRLAVPPSPAPSGSASPSSPIPGSLLDQSESGADLRLPCQPDVILHLTVTGTVLASYGATEKSLHPVLVAEEPSSTSSPSSPTFCLSPLVVEQWRSAMTQALGAGECGCIEFDLPPLSSQMAGTPEPAPRNRQYEARLVPFQNNQIIAMVRDITDCLCMYQERIQAELALRISEAWFRALMHSIPGAVYRYSPTQNGITDFISRAIEDITGYPICEFINQIRSWESIIHPDDQARVRQSLTDSLNTARPYYLEYRILHADGSIRWVSNQGCVSTLNVLALNLSEVEWTHLNSSDLVPASLAPTSSGQWLDGIILDITKQKQAEAELKESEARYRSLADNMLDGIYLLSSEHQILFINYGIEQILQRSQEFFFTKQIQGWISCIHPDDRPHFFTALTTPAVENEIELIYRILRPDGEVRYVRDTMHAVRGTDGSILAYQGLISDITEMKQAEATARQQAEEERLLGIITQQIRQTLDLDDILNTTVTQVRQVLQADRVLIYQLTADGSGMVVVEAIEGDWQSLWGHSIHDRSLYTEADRTAYLSGQVQAIDDIYIATCPFPYIQFWAQFQVRANLVVPIIQGNQLWGLLIANHCHQPYHWQSREIDLLKRLADQVGIAIQQSELYQQLGQAHHSLQQQAAQEEVLGAIAQRIRCSLDLEAILQTTVDEVRQLLQTDRVIISRINTAWKRVVIVESVDEQFPTLLTENGSHTYSIIDSAHLSALAQGWVDALSDIYSSNLTAIQLEALETLQVKARLIVPIFQGEELWGLLIAHHCQSARHWQVQEIELLQRLATQVGIATQQAELYQELQTANLELRRIASLDSLTQIPNRRRFDQALQEEWQRALEQQTPLAVIMCDIDCFKAYNDGYGHPAGDRCLQQIAQSIQRSVKRPTDLVCRYGGEEFAIILPATDLVGAVQVAGGVRSRVRTAKIDHHYSRVGQSVTISLGVASLIPTADSEPAALLAAADQALYRAKARGGDRIVTDLTPDSNSTEDDPLP